MLWKVLDKAGTIAYLLLSTILITILLTNTSETAGKNNFEKILEAYKQENSNTRTNNINYFEGRINRLSETQDNYQITSSSRLLILEQKILKMEAEDKKSNRVINTNVNTWTQGNGNGIPVP